MSNKHGIAIKSTSFPFFPGINNANGKQYQTPQDPPMQVGSLLKPESLQRDKSKARDLGNGGMGAGLGSGEVKSGNLTEDSSAGLAENTYKVSSANSRSIGDLISRENSIQSPEEENRLQARQVGPTVELVQN